jgi:hypothetical protein
MTSRAEGQVYFVGITITLKTLQTQISIGVYYSTDAKVWYDISVCTHQIGNPRRWDMLC